MDQDFGAVDETGASLADPVRAGAPAAATADEGLRLLRAFRAVACPRTRSRILALVLAAASRVGETTLA